MSPYVADYPRRRAPDPRAPTGLLPRDRVPSFACAERQIGLWRPGGANGAARIRPAHRIPTGRRPRDPTSNRGAAGETLATRLYGALRAEPTECARRAVARRRAESARRQRSYAARCRLQLRSRRACSSAREARTRRAGLYRADHAPRRVAAAQRISAYSARATRRHRGSRVVAPRLVGADRSSSPNRPAPGQARSRYVERALGSATTLPEARPSGGKTAAADAGAAFRTRDGPHAWLLTGAAPQHSIVEPFGGWPKASTAGLRDSTAGSPRAGPPATLFAPSRICRGRPLCTRRLARRPRLRQKRARLACRALLRRRGLALPDAVSRSGRSPRLPYSCSDASRERPSRSATSLCHDPLAPALASRPGRLPTGAS